MFAIFEEDFTEAAGQLTPTMKVRRQVIMEQFAAQVAALYGEAISGEHGNDAFGLAAEAVPGRPGWSATAAHPARR